jgi:ribosomal protein S18 acetylase RimI-like enzyme
MAKVRDALSQDARRCAEVHISSWRAGYDGLLPDDYLHGLTVEDRLPWWKEILAAPPEARELAIAVVEDETGEVCGFGSVRVDPSDARSAEVGQLYVDPSAWGTGVAELLMARLLADLVAQGVEDVTLRVALGNSRACRFYERGGWRRVEASERTEEVWGVEVLTLEYRLARGRS